MFESLLFRPNFPSAPQRTFDFYKFPNDLTTDTRNYYTEIEFYAYDSGFRNPTIAPAAPSPEIGNTGVDLIGDAASFINRTTFFQILGQGKAGVALANIKLPLPQRINDTLTFSWGEGSATENAVSILQNLTLNSNMLYNGGQIAGALIQGGGIISGYAINPLMFQQFQRPNFREFSFQWNLAPRTRTESATIASMITILKRAASPAKSLGGVAYEYPLVAMIKFYPNNLSGHPGKQIGGIIMKPCIIQAISVDYTPTGGPAFFNGAEGAPVIVGLSIAVKELQLLYREDYDPETQSPTG